MNAQILVINAGSSSVKYKLFNFPSGSLILKGLVERIGEKGSSVKNHLQAIEKVLGSVKEKIGSLDKISGIGHRVVHGGEKFREPVIIDSSVIKEIRRNIKLAPLHNPANLEGILACRKILPNVKQAAVFDTAFHQTIPEYAYMYAIPWDYYRKYKIRKYGFHGTSHNYVAHKAAEILGRPFNKLKIITVHLGNGCSMAAINRGRCIDTSMGFTPLQGLIMGTRCGDIDPAIVLFMAKECGLSWDEIDKILNKKSGLLGISRISNDFREILSQVNKGNKYAKLALDMFAYSVKKYIGAYILILGGLDACIFTAGIGEHNSWLVNKIRKDLNRILKPAPKVLIIPTDEEKMIASLSYKLIKKRLN